VGRVGVAHAQLGQLLAPGADGVVQVLVLPAGVDIADAGLAHLADKRLPGLVLVDPQAPELEV
jgi:hypothetical protein